MRGKPGTIQDLQAFNMAKLLVRETRLCHTEDAMLKQMKRGESREIC